MSKLVEILSGGQPSHILSLSVSRRICGFSSEPLRFVVYPPPPPSLSLSLSIYIYIYIYIWKCGVKTQTSRHNTMFLPLSCLLLTLGSLTFTGPPSVSVFLLVPQAAMKFCTILFAGHAVCLSQTLEIFRRMNPVCPHTLKELYSLKIERTKQITRYTERVKSKHSARTQARTQARTHASTHARTHARTHTHTPLVGQSQ